MEKPIFIKHTRKDEKRRQWFGLYKCLCGNEFEARCTDINTGHTRSCGCIQINHIKTLAKRTCLKHGMTKTRIHDIYYGIHERCNVEKNKSYHRYGGRGIKNLFTSFEHFLKWSMQNGYKEHLSIDRINNDGNYEPSNCRWIERAKQAQNRRDTVYIEYKGEKTCIAEVARLTGMSYEVVYRRHNQGMSIDEIISKPVQNGIHFFNVKGCRVSARQLGLSLGIDYKFITRRIERGLSAKEIFSDIKQKVYRDKKAEEVIGENLEFWKN